MDNKKLEAWVWVLIYGGMIGISLGWFLRSRSAALAWPVLVLGAASIAGGALLIFLRSRRRPEGPQAGSGPHFRSTEDPPR